MVVEGGCVLLLGDGTNINLLLVDHYHHLPLVLVFGDTSIPASSELVEADIHVSPLGLILNDNLVWVHLACQRLANLILDLVEHPDVVVGLHLTLQLDLELRALIHLQCVIAVVRVLVLGLRFQHIHEALKLGVV